MMAWLNPAALIGLAFVAGPVIVHLLRRQRSRRVLFPSLRFVQPSRAAAVRVHMPADWPLLALRIAIITLAVLALAQPIVVSSGRLASWNARIARVVVVDRTGMVGGDQTTAEIAAAELRSAAFATRLDADVVAEALPRAVATLGTLPPARREIVVVSPVRMGSLAASDLAAVPAAIGIRFAQVDGPVAQVTIPGMTLFGYEDVVGRRHSIALGETSTAVTVERAPAAARGLRVIAPAGSERDVAGLLRAVALAGSPAPSAEEPIAVFLGGEVPRSKNPMTARWMVRTITGVANDLELQRHLADNSHRPTNDESSAFALRAQADKQTTNHDYVLLRDRERRPLLSAAKSADGGDELVFQSPVAPHSFMAAAIVRAALVARHGSVAIREREIARTPVSQLQAWTRPAAPVTVDDVRRGGFSDARGVWALVLLLIGVETLARRVRPARRVEVEANAA